MKTKITLITTILGLAITINAMEQKDNDLKHMLIEGAPLSLKFQAAWHAVRTGQNLNLTGAEHIVDLGNKLKYILQCDMCSFKEKKLLINLISDPELPEDKIQTIFSDLFEKYQSISEGKKVKNKQELLNAMLLNALSENNALIVKILADLGADVNVKDKWGNTPLMHAAYNGCKERVELLLNVNADVNSESMYGNTPLMWAASEGYTEIVQLLISANANINHTNTRDYTSLMHGVIKGHKEVVKILLQSGCDINIQNGNGDTALTLAMKIGLQDIAQMLKEAEALAFTL